MNKEKITEKIMDYLSDRVQLEDYKEIERGIISILENQEDEKIFSPEIERNILINASVLQGKMKEVLENILEKKRVKINLNSYETYTGLNHFASMAYDSHMNFALNLGVANSHPVVVHLSGYILHQMMDVLTNRDASEETWQRAGRRFTEEETKLSTDYFHSYFMEAFQEFFRGWNKDIKLTLLDQSDNIYDLELYLPKGEMYVAYLGMTFDYKNGSTVGENSYILIPCKSIEQIF